MPTTPVNVTIVPAICETCLTSYGFNGTDKRSLLILIIGTSLILISCYIGVLWYAIYTRKKPEKKSDPATTYNNEAFDKDIEEDDYDDYIQPIDNSDRPPIITTTQQVRSMDDNEKFP